MATIAENLQTLVEQKAAIKAALETQGKEPTDKLKTYAGLIEDLENPDKVEYCVTIDGENKAYAQLYGQEKVQLTATENDIRLGTTAITDCGCIEGKKDIPPYHTDIGKKVVQAGSAVTITVDRYDYTEIQAILCKYNTSISDSVEVSNIAVDNSVYGVGSTKKLADITKDSETTTINLGITAAEKSVLRYIIIKEEA